MPSQVPPQCKLIAVEGCIGSGKTTIARGLAGLRGSRLLEEDFSAVPFLEKFYATPERFALETEFAFLLQHYHQLHIAAQQGGEIVADFMFSKDLLFAELNMKEKDEKDAFTNLHRVLAGRLPKIALTVFLSASDELIIDRIKNRGRSFETKVDSAYYQRVNAAYERHFATHEGPLLRVERDEMDFCAAPELFQWLSREIGKKLMADHPPC